MKIGMFEIGVHLVYARVQLFTTEPMLIGLGQPKIWVQALQLGTCIPNAGCRYLVIHTPPWTVHNYHRAKVHWHRGEGVDFPWVVSTVNTYEEILRTTDSRLLRIGNIFVTSEPMLIGLGKIGEIDTCLSTVLITMQCNIYTTIWDDKDLSEHACNYTIGSFV